MRHIVICGLCGSTIFFSHYLINGKILKKKVKENGICFDFSTIPFETFLILTRNERDMTTDVYWSSCKVSVVLVVRI